MKVSKIQNGGHGGSHIGKILSHDKYFNLEPVQILLIFTDLFSLSHYFMK